MGYKTSPGYASFCSSNPSIVAGPTIYSSTTTGPLCAVLSLRCNARITTTQSHWDSDVASVDAEGLLAECRAPFLEPGPEPPTRAVPHTCGNSRGITRIERLITDNHFSYRRSNRVAKVIGNLGATHKFIRPHCRGCGVICTKPACRVSVRGVPVLGSG
jgi:hypothetical protein